MRQIIVALVVICLVAAASGDGQSDREKRIKEEIAKLEGTWLAVNFIDDGERESEEVLKYVRWTFKSDTVLITKALTVTEDGKTTVKGQGGTIEARYQVDPLKNPKVLTMTTIRPIKGIVTRSIYFLEANVLKVCGYKDKNELPSEFLADKDSGRIIITLKKEN